MLAFSAAVLCSLLYSQVATAQPPSFYEPAACQHPDKAVQSHLQPVNDEEILVALQNEEEKGVDTWTPDTSYQVILTSPNKLEVLVSVNGGQLEKVGEGTEECDGQFWYTSDKETSHEFKWTSPACCNFTGEVVQLFVTGSLGEEDYLRQQQALLTGDQSECSCDTAESSPAAETLTLPTDKASEIGGTRFTDGEELEVDELSGGEVDPNSDGSDNDQVETTEPNSTSSFGYAFLIMLLTIAIALSSVWFYRRYRVRAMRNREFDGLEMRGYAQWSEQAGL